MTHLKTKAIARAFLGLGLSGLVLGLSASTVQAGTVDSKTDRFLWCRIQKGEKKGWTSVIVKFRGTPNAAQSKRLAALKVDVYRHLDLIDSLAIRIPTRNLKRLAELNFVERMSEDATMKKCDEFITESSGADTAFGQYGLTGNGVTVAVLDSGIDNNVDLANPKTGASRVLASVSFVPYNSSVADLYGHGTHVAGIIGGNGAASTGNGYYRTFYGIARKSNLVNVRVLNALGQTDVSSVIAALNWCVTNKAKYNIRVINMSMGHSVGESYTTDPLCQAAEKAWKAGIVVVASAGNDGRQSGFQLGSRDNEGYGTNYGSIGCPGNDPYVITVGAMKSADKNRNHDTIATYSSRGPSRLDYIVKPDIVAAGNQVASVRKPLSFIELTSPGSVVPVTDYKRAGLLGGLLGQSNYMKLSGTSMATPVVSGAVALMLEANPTLTPDTIKARLMASADKWTNSQNVGEICTYGAGYLNIPAALKSNLVAKRSALSPELDRADDGNLYVVPDSSNGGLWGTGILNFDTIFGTRAVWGNAKVASPRAMWGNSVWGDRAMWGNDLFGIDLGIIVLFGE